MQTNISATQRVLPIIRVFVSSTFSDLKHERNVLHAQVWPELERYCQQRGFTFQAIDLRWGVSAEAGLDHRTMRICLEELSRAQETSPEPNFLILLGNRYGWRPLPEVISVEEFEKLKTAADQIQNGPPDPAEELTDRHVDLRKKAVAVLGDWYLLDENARPFGEDTLPGQYVLRTRKTLLNGVDYGQQPEADGRLRDTDAWADVQFVLWSIVNRAFPAADLAGRFKARHETSPDTLPSCVRFQASATEQEIWHGALQAENADRHVIAAIREIDDLDAIPDTPCRGEFIDLKDNRTPDVDARQALADLKTELNRRLDNTKSASGASKIIRSTCQWAVDQENNPTGDITISHLDEFCREIQERLKSLIIEQINAYWDCDLSADDATLAQVRGSQQELNLECADHLRFACERAPEKTFVGRESELQRIRDYLHSETNRPLVVHGPSGSGKTALLGKFIQEVTPLRSADGTRAKTGPIVVTRFIGTTPESSNLRSLLASLCRELRQDFELPEPLPTDLGKLIDEFYMQLGKATAIRPVFIFLDALDQLDAADNGRSGCWIKSPLYSMKGAAGHARMIVSCLSPSGEFPEDSEACEPFRDLKRRKLLGDLELGALDETEARKLFARWLHDAGRSLSRTQQKAISQAMRRTSACRQPLFLKVLFEEARRWPSFDAPSSIPESLAQLLDELFIRLEKPSEHGKLIDIALSYLVLTRYGLSEGELLEILFKDPEYNAILADDNTRNSHELPPGSNRIPIAPWTRLRSDLAAYLSERSAPGTAVIHFYHRNLIKAVHKRYLPSEQKQRLAHAHLARYFRDKTDPSGRGRWDGGSQHGFSELLYHSNAGALVDLLSATMADPVFAYSQTERAGWKVARTEHIAVSDQVRRPYRPVSDLLVGGLKYWPREAILPMCANLAIHQSSTKRLAAPPPLMETHLEANPSRLWFAYSGSQTVGSTGNGIDLLPKSVAWSPDGASLAISAASATYFCGDSSPAIRSVPVKSTRVFFSKSGRLAALVSKMHVAVVDVRKCQILAQTSEIQFSTAADFSPDEQTVVFAGRDLATYAWRKGRIKQHSTFGRNHLLFVAYDGNAMIIGAGYPEYFVVLDEHGRVIHVPRPGSSRHAISRLLPTQAGIVMVTAGGLEMVDSLGSGYAKTVEPIKNYGSFNSDDAFEYACNPAGSLIAHADGAGVSVRCLTEFHGINAGSQFFVWPGDWQSISLRFGRGDRLFVAHVIGNRLQVLCFTPTLAGRAIE